VKHARHFFPRQAYATSMGSNLAISIYYSSDAKRAAPNEGRGFIKCLLLDLTPSPF
jgi:hypothetical protein